MEAFSTFVGAQYLLHGLIVAGVLFGTVLVFTFGFRSAEEPNFAKLSSNNGSKVLKKKKKENKTAQLNGFATGVKTDTKAKGAASRSKDEPKVKKSRIEKKVKSEKVSRSALQESNTEKQVKINKGSDGGKIKGKENITSKKKNRLDTRQSNEDEDGWQQAVSRKNRKSQSQGDEKKQDKNGKKQKTGKGDQGDDKRKLDGDQKTSKVKKSDQTKKSKETSQETGKNKRKEVVSSEGK